VEIDAHLHPRADAVLSDGSAAELLGETATG
jgi:hypothetical protein